MLNVAFNTSVYDPLTIKTIVSQRIKSLKSYDFRMLEQIVDFTSFFYRKIMNKIYVV